MIVGNRYYEVDFGTLSDVDFLNTQKRRNLPFILERVFFYNPMDFEISRGIISIIDDKVRYLIFKSPILDKLPNNHSENNFINISDIIIDDDFLNLLIYEKYYQYYKPITKILVIEVCLSFVSLLIDSMVIFIYSYGKEKKFYDEIIFNYNMKLLYDS